MRGGLEETPGVARGRRNGHQAPRPRPRPRAADITGPAEGARRRARADHGSGPCRPRGQPRRSRPSPRTGRRRRVGRPDLPRRRRLTVAGARRRAGDHPQGQGAGRRRGRRAELPRLRRPVRLPVVPRRPEQPPPRAGGDPRHDAGAGREGHRPPGGGRRRTRGQDQHPHQDGERQLASATRPYPHQRQRLPSPRADQPLPRTARHPPPRARPPPRDGLAAHRPARPRRPRTGPRRRLTPRAAAAPTDAASARPLTWSCLDLEVLDVPVGWCIRRPTDPGHADECKNHAWHRDQCRYQEDPARAPPQDGQ